MKRISAVLMVLTLTVTIAALRSRASAETAFNANGAESIIAGARALAADPQGPSLPLPGAPTSEAAPEPYLAYAYQNSTNSSWMGSVKAPSDDDFDTAVKEVIKDCAEAGNDSALVGKRIKFVDTDSNQAAVFQLCAANGKGVQNGRSYVLLTGDAKFVPYDGEQQLKDQAEKKAVAALAKSCADQTQDGSARIIGEVRGGIEGDVAHAVGVCRYRLPQ